MSARAAAPRPFAEAVLRRPQLALLHRARPLRVLVVHSRYLSGQTSGENRVVEDEITLLHRAGCDVSTVVRQVDADLGKAALARDVVWSRSAVREVEGAIARQCPDVVHFHNLFPAVSPAPLRAAEQAGVPTVVTLHNFRFLCLAGTFLRDARPCEDCAGRTPWPGVARGCYRGSRAQSAVLASSLRLHRLLGTQAGVTLFLALSHFSRTKHVEAGFPEEAIRVRPNFAAAAPVRNGPGEYFVYLGRLSPEKGLLPLVRSWPAGSRLVVVGDGPERTKIEQVGAPGVELRGAVGPLEARALLQGARALVAPSLNYEGSPRAILESFAAGVPVLASDIGGLPELVNDGANGLLLPPGDAASWREGVQRLRDPGESMRLGSGAHASWQAHYSPDRGLETLVGAYGAAIARHRGRSRLGRDQLAESVAVG